jgi:hypothetical protein
MMHMQHNVKSFNVYLNLVHVQPSVRIICCRFRYSSLKRFAADAADVFNDLSPHSSLR